MKTKKPSSPHVGATEGNCYATCEALYHLLGGSTAGYVPHTVRHEGSVHWYLVHRKQLFYKGWPNGHDEIVIDPTASQFSSTPPYSEGRGRGFLTKGPSRKAREMMQRMVWK